RGLNPVGLLAGLLSASCGFVSSFGVCGSAVFVTPALKRGLNPVGLLAGLLSASCSFVSSFGVCGSAVFVTPALKRGLKPAGFEDIVVAVGFEANSCNTSVATA